MAVEIDVTPKPEGAYRIAVWTVGPAIERKYSRIEALDADIVIAARSGTDARLLRANKQNHSSMAWIGRHAQRGLGVMGFGPTFVKLDGSRWDQRLEWIMPVQVNGPVGYHLLAVWAMNERAQVKFKTNPAAAQPIQMTRLYRRILAGPTIVAGDFDNNPVFHRNDPNWDMLEIVAQLDAVGLTSAYHTFTGLEHGDPREQPTRFRPDPILESVAHHVDYCFVPTSWIPHMLGVQIGDREVWARTGRTEEHVPLVIDFETEPIREVTLALRKQRRAGER